LVATVPLGMSAATLVGKNGCLSFQWNHVYRW